MEEKIRKCLKEYKERIINKLYQPGTGRPPLADNIGAVTAVRASFTIAESANALPHRIRDARSMSAAAKPLAYCVPEPRIVLMLLLFHTFIKKGII